MITLFFRVRLSNEPPVNVALAVLLAPMPTVEFGRLTVIWKPSMVTLSEVNFHDDGIAPAGAGKVDSGFTGESGVGVSLRLKGGGLVDHDGFVVVNRQRR